MRPLIQAVVVSSLVTVSTAHAGGNVVFRETFNQLTATTTPPSPWVVESSGGGSVTAQDVPFAGNRSVRVQKLNASGVSSLSRNLGALTGRVVVDTRVMARETAGFKGLPYLYDDRGSAIVSIAFQDGNIRAWVGGLAETVQPFQPNVWYQVRVVVDTNSDTFDLFIDGVRKEHGRPLRARTTNVDRVSFYLDGVNTGTAYVDQVTVYREADYIGAPKGPVFEARAYGAVGNGVALDTAALQRAINAASGTGGSVVLSRGTFLSGTLTLGSNMTFYVDSSATLLGTTSSAEYPTQSPNTGNTQLSNCRRALLYAPNTTLLNLDGGGTIDGQGDAFKGAESLRPMLIWAVGSDHFTVQNLYLKKGAVWGLVSMETDHVLINNVNLQSDGITHDGIDLVDGFDVVVQNVAVRSGDDAMCLKTGVRRGLDTVVIRDSMFSGSNGGSNGIKFGTASYGAFRNVTVEDSFVKDVQYAAMAVESRQGADVDSLRFSRITLSDVGTPFFVYLAQQGVTHPAGDVPKLGHVNGLAFTDISGWTKSWQNSPHQGALITGHLYLGTAYRITNLDFTDVHLTFTGGRQSTPRGPPEAKPNQYPESNMFGDLPAWGYYLRHVSGVTFTRCSSKTAGNDVRATLATSDVVNLRGTP